MKKYILLMVGLVTAVLFNGLLYTALCNLIEQPVAAIISVAVLIYSVMPWQLLSNGKMSYSLRATIYRELWTDELIKAFNFKGKWAEKIPDRNDLVEGVVMNLTKIGADPSVLINNTTYPITTAQRTDTNVPIIMDKLDTTNTQITDDELLGLPYDKNASVIEQHKAKLELQAMRYGLYNLTVSGNTGTTPVIETTGADRADGSGSKRLLPDDIITYKEKLDLLEIPEEFRMIVLNSKHASDLANKATGDQVFRDIYTDFATGKPLSRYMGFWIYIDVATPYFSAGNAKKAFGAAVTQATDKASSVGINITGACKGKGSTKMYAALAEDRPETRDTIMGFRMFHKMVGYNNVGFGAIISGKV